MTNKRACAIITTIIGIIIMVVSGTYLAAVDRINSERLKIVERNIIDSATECIFDEICEYSDKIYLKELYENEYLDEQINPKTKEFFSLDSYVDIDNNKFVLVIVK